MADNAYHFTTRWRVQGTPAEVYAVLDDPADLVRWWPAVYLEVKPLEPGDTRAVGKTFDLHTKGWLPYTLRWRLRTAAKEPPERIVVEAQGDFVGRGVWTLRGDGAWVDVTFEWQVEADKPLLRSLSWLLRPVFSANHRWAMARGEESLGLELARRRAPTAAEAAQVPPPPGPSKVSWGTVAVLLAGAALILVVGLYKLVQVMAGG
jgi:hypothetical protein